MEIIINAKSKEVKSGNFNYSNIESAYGVNTQYFTKNGKPYTVIAGEMHFSRLPKERWRETTSQDARMWYQYGFNLCILELS